MEKLIDESVSKQALWKRINTEECASFFKLALSTVVKSKLPQDIPNPNYKRILIQDSTIIQLPAKLFESFSGVANGHVQVCNARIQAVYELLTGGFVSFSIDSYTKNDAKAACELELQKDDLILRDRGYSGNDEVKRYIENEADFIIRYKHKSIYLHPKTTEPLNLLSILKKQGKIDLTVRLNNKEQTLVRLVAAPVSQEIANIRRMKARREAKGATPSKELLQLMDWTIFITSIVKEKVTFDQLLQLYGLRWRIENIFKAWKNNLQFSAIHNVSKNQFLCIVIARFIMIVIAFSRIFIPMQTIVLTQFNKYLSLMKTIRYLQINNNILEVFYVIKENLNIDSLAKTLARYCSYDSRLHRLNFTQKQHLILTQINLIPLI